MVRHRPFALLFDLDGTLIDSIELILSAYRHTFADRDGAAPTDDQWIAGIGTPLATQLRPFATDDADLASMVERYRVFQRAHHDRLTRCYDDVPATIAKLRARGHPLAVVTSKSDELAHRGLQWVGLHEAMDAIVGCEACARHKPDPEPVLVALERLGYAADEAVFVGDSPHDVAAGNAAGVITVGALWGPFTRAVLASAKPHYYLERMADLPDLLDRLDRRFGG